MIELHSDILGHHKCPDILGHHTCPDILGHHMCKDILGHHKFQAILGHKYLNLLWHNKCQDSSGAVWESRWTSWAVRPNEPSGFRGRKDLLNRASALVTTCP